MTQKLWFVTYKTEKGGDTTEASILTDIHPIEWLYSMHKKENPNTQYVITFWTDDVPKSVRKQYDNF